MKRWIWGAGICALLVGCDEDWGAGRTGKSQGAQSGVPACTEPTHRLAPGPRNVWQPRAPGLWFVSGSAGGERLVVDFDGETVAEPWPENESPPASNPTAVRLPLPEGAGVLALPAESAVPGARYRARLQMVLGSHAYWSAAEVTDEAGKLRMLSVGGDVYQSKGALEPQGWTVEFKPVCWTRDCWDPYLHHDVTLRKGQQSWYLAHGTVAEIDAGGRPFRVYNDAAGMPGKGARSLCTDLADSKWSLVILALD